MTHPGGNESKAPKTVSGQVLVGALALLVLGVVGGLLWSGIQAQNDPWPITGRWPAPIEAAALPEPESEGARLLQRHCTGCHAIPDPGQHFAHAWPASLHDMRHRMRTTPMMPVPVPDEAGWKTLEAYLRTHARPMEAPGADQRL